MLRDDGVIFVSIDDNEVAHLRMLLDEIFGEPNFIANIIWEKKYSRTNDAEYLSDNHDHILLYAKSKKLWKPVGLARTEAQLKAFKNPDNHPLGLWQDVVYTCNKTNEERPNLFYPIKNPFTGEEVWPLPNRVWGAGPETTAINEKEDRLWWGEHGEKKKPRLKLFLSELEEGVVANTIWKRDEVGDNQEAERVLREIVPEHKFLGVKPPKLIKRIIKIATGPEDLVLDSFAGSGTTAQAVLEVNREDGGDRTFVLIQQPYETKENEKAKLNIARSITIERVRRLMRGYKFSGTKEELLLEEKLNLAVLKTADGLVERIAAIRQEKKSDFEKIITQFNSGAVRLIGQKTFEGEAPGIGGSFTYAALGAQLFGEYRALGKKPPTYDELSKYIFYTETSRDFDKKVRNLKTGKIGEFRKTSYYLLYTPNNKEDQALDLKWLRSIEKSEKNRNLVVYCEKIWIHRDDLTKYQKETGRKVRPMLVPFNLK